MCKQHIRGQSHDVVEDQNNSHASQDFEAFVLIAADVNHTTSLIWYLPVHH